MTGVAVKLDENLGRPVANGIVWQDRRTAAACEALRAHGLEPLFRERTGLLLDPYFSGTKVYSGYLTALAHRQALHPAAVRRPA